MAIAQLGTTVKVGFSASIGNLILEDVTTESTGEQSIIKDENNATGTILISDLGKRLTFSAVVGNNYGGDLPPALGSIIAYNSVNYRVESTSYKQTRTQSILNVTGIKEVAMTYTA